MASGYQNFASAYQSGAPLLAQDIFPQLPNEPNVVYGTRSLLNNMTTIPAMKGIREVDQTLGQMFDTPAKAKARAGAAPMPHAFDDPVWSAYEQKVAEGYGNPTLANALSKLRLLGERSNSDQVSSAGAKTPYQITPQTREGIMKLHGFDPWASPENAVRGAAIAATTYTGPKANFNDPNVLAKAAGGYFGGKAGADNPYSGMSDGGNTVAEYTQRVMGPDTPLHAPFINPYDQRYDKAAFGELDKAQAAAKTPWSTSVDVGPAPEMPKPEAIPQTDFTKADEALQELKPIEMSEKDKLRRERDGWFKGLAQAMMSTPGNEGLGTFFMRLGGATLGGREQARDEIRAEQDKFDTKMAQYRAAVFSNEMGKAKVHAVEAQAQVEQNNAYNHANWQTAYERWKGNGQVDISGTNAVISRTTPDGKRTVDVLPIGPAVDSAFAQKRAEMFSSVGGRQFAGNQQITGMENAIVGRQAIAAMSGSAVGAEADAAAAAAPAAYATFVASTGAVADVVGPDGAKSLEQSIQKQLMAQQVVPGSKDYTDKHDKMLAVELTKLALGDPNYMKKLIAAGSTLGNFEALDAVNSRKITTRTDPKTGMTTTGSTMNAADVFDSDAFNDNLTAHGYTRR